MADIRSKWCRHYTAYPATECKVGISYDSLPQPRPCVNFDRTPSNWGQCPQFSEYTTAELDEQDRQSEAAWKAYVTALDEGKCPHCGAAIEQRKQVGRCVYARPCGHRLYQGRA